MRGADLILESIYLITTFSCQNPSLEQTFQIRWKSNQDMTPNFMHIELGKTIREFFTYKAVLVIYLKTTLLMKQFLPELCMFI